jgi:hypothetical protein
LSLEVEAAVDQNQVVVLDQHLVQVQEDIERQVLDQVRCKEMPYFYLQDLIL